MKTKDRILSILKETRGQYISGQEIADKVFVTRAAVWKAIKALEKDGYDIDAVTNKGYRLRYMPDIIDIGMIIEKLHQSVYDLEVHYFDKVESTNDTALALALNNNHLVVVIADAQTKGRGRRGRAFYSPSNTGLYMSVAVKIDKNIDYYKTITAKAAAATALAIDEVVFAGEDKTAIKWVNDIYLNELKVAGILTEIHGSLEDDCRYLVIGIGVNVYPPVEDFPKEIKNVAGAVLSGDSQSDRAVRNELCIAIVHNLCSFMNQGKEIKETASDSILPDIWKIYTDKSFLIGNYIKINSFDGNHEYAFVDGISEDFELMVTYEDGRKDKLSTGEVSVVKY